MAKVYSTEYKPIAIPNLAFEYRIGDMGDVQKLAPNGVWVTIQPYKGKRHKVMYVKLHKADGGRKAVPVVRLMDDAFFGGYAKKHHLCITHRNGMKTDCSKYNILFVSPFVLNLRNKNSCQGVVKLDLNGNVVERYESCKEAAEKNFMSRTAMYHRVNNKLKNPAHLDGFIYKLERDYDE